LLKTPFSINFFYAANVFFCVIEILNLRQTHLFF
jgi:hypothetical protein